MLQDYRELDLEQLELLEKQTLRTIVQAIQEYSREARQIFEEVRAESETEVIVLAEDLVQYALEVAEVYPINKRFAGFIDYKRVRWCPTGLGLFPQVLLVDAKASTENYRETLQQSQLSMDAEFISKGGVIKLSAGIPPHMPIAVSDGSELPAVTSSVFIHFHYEKRKTDVAPYRTLRAIYALMMPHARLKSIYNPTPEKTFFGQGKHSPARDEAQRIRVYYQPLRAMAPWRLQELRYEGDAKYASPYWTDGPGESPTRTPFRFIGR